MQAVVMAAGLGQRLQNLTENKPKALVRVAGRELLDYVLEFLNKEIIDEIFIVVGYRGEMIEKFVEDKKYEKKINIMKNENYTKGNILSLLSALPYIHDSLILMNVDHIYYNERIFDIITRDIKGITAICDFDRDLMDDDMKVLIKEGKVIKISKKLSDYSGGYVGMTVVPSEYLKRYKNMAFEISKKYDGNVHVESILQHLADEGIPIYYKDISGLGWVEVDTLEDLEKAEKIMESLKIDRSTPHLNGL